MKGYKVVWAQNRRVKISIPHETYNTLCCRRVEVGYVPTFRDELLGAFAKLRNATISFVMSVGPSFRPHVTTQLPMYGFSLNLIFEYV
jgi:hypothetical protein